MFGPLYCSFFPPFDIFVARPLLGRGGGPPLCFCGRPCSFSSSSSSFYFSCRCPNVVSITSPHQPNRQTNQSRKEKEDTTTTHEAPDGSRFSLSLSLSLFRSLSPSLSRCFLFRSRFFFIRARLPPPPPSRALPVFAFVLNYLP